MLVAGLVLGLQFLDRSEAVTLDAFELGFTQLVEDAGAHRLPDSAGCRRAQRDRGHHHGSRGPKPLAHGRRRMKTTNPMRASASVKAMPKNIVVRATPADSG